MNAAEGSPDPSGSSSRVVSLNWNKWLRQNSPLAIYSSPIGVGARRPSALDVAVAVEKGSQYYPKYYPAAIDGDVSH